MTPSLLVAGVDLSGRSRGRTAVAWLAGRSDAMPAVEHVEDAKSLRDDIKLTEVLTQRGPQVVAVDAPLSLPHAVTCSDPDCLRCFPADGLLPSVATRALEAKAALSAIGQVGKAPMPTAMLAGLAFRGIYVGRLMRRAGVRVIETWPMGVYRRLLSMTTAVQGADGDEAWRRELLGRVVVGLDAACDHGSAAARDQFDAVAAGYAAWCFATERFEVVGEESDREGAIIIPRAS